MDRELSVRVSLPLAGRGQGGGSPHRPIETKR